MVGWHTNKHAVPHAMGSRIMHVRTAILQWFPAQWGSSENEIADELAKESPQRDQPVNSVSYVEKRQGLEKHQGNQKSQSVEKHQGN